MTSPFFLVKKDNDVASEVKVKSKISKDCLACFTRVVELSTIIDVSLRECASP